MTENGMSSFSNKRTIDRAAIMEEIEQNKINEIRSNIIQNKTFTRKFPKYQANNTDPAQKKIMVS